MSIERHLALLLRSVSIWALAVAFPATTFVYALGQENVPRRKMRVLSGYVQQVNGTPVADFIIGVHGAGSVKTKDHGDFELPLPAAIQNGFVITLYVQDGWVITEPTWNGNPGCPLPAPDVQPTRVLVAKVGDEKALLSDPAIEILLLGATSHFGQLAKLPLENGSLAQVAKLVNAALPAQGDVIADRQRKRAKKYFDWWLNDRARVLGVRREDIELAISSWTERNREGLDGGLGALYAGNIERAISLFTGISSRSTGNGTSRVAATQALAFAYALNGNYERAQESLQQAFKETKQLDANMLVHLGYVLRMAGKSEEATSAFERAQMVIKENGLDTRLTSP